MRVAWAGRNEKALFAMNRAFLILRIGSARLESKDDRVD
jgi:hypothetical protein